MTFIPPAGGGLAAHSGHTGPSHLPRTPCAGQPDPTLPWQQLGQHRSSPGKVTMPPPSTFPLGLLLPLCFPAAVTAAPGKAVPAPCPELGITSATFCRGSSLAVVATIHHSTHLDSSDFSLVGTAGSSSTSLLG